MFKSVTSQSITAVIAAGLVASFVALVTSAAPVAKAEPLIGGETQVEAKAVVETVNERPCSLQSWPNYEQSCQFDLREPSDERRIVRIIVLR
jgi:hypothetical protein